jgi:dimethylhistidine N-methyltransferase
MKMQSPMELNRPPARSPVLAELNAGLRAYAPSISPKFLYDSLGSRLFEAICELPEYYPTRTEASIFARNGHAIANAVGLGRTLIDLGAGNCAKPANLLPLFHPAQYVAIDISAAFVRESLERLQQRYPNIVMTALGLDFSNALDLPSLVRREKRLFFYPGSSIGNFAPAEAEAFLRRVHAQCDDDSGLLIGIDLVKDRATLDAAYDDALGITAAFNLNMLRHVNRLAGADFDVRQWRHSGKYNALENRIEMHLEAIEALTVHWHNGERTFRAGERIHTENSYKYTQSAAVELLEKSGFRTTGVWTDPDGWFAVIHARPIAAGTV